MFYHFMRFDSTAKSTLFCQDKMFINLIKIFVLNIGILDKKGYEEILRSLMLKNSKVDFDKFLNCFDKILKYEDEYSVLKYKFLLNIILKDENQKFVSAKELQTFFKMINCDKKNEVINEEITNNLINFYSVIYKKENPKKFPIDKLLILIEFFFDNK